jgi:hypothetical protein
LNLAHFLSIPMLLTWLLTGIQTNAQDHLLLKNEDGILECYITQINDSIIKFRTLDPADTYEYEISVSETYGYLLENPKYLPEILYKKQHNKLLLKHLKKNRERIFFENQSMVFKLSKDSGAIARKGKIIEITADSIQLEIRKKRITERLNFAIHDISEFGYTTLWTEIASLIILPVSALQDGTMRFYKNLTRKAGWQTHIEPEPQPDLVKKRVKRNGHGRKSIQLPAVVKRSVR